MVGALAIVGLSLLAAPTTAPPDRLDEFLEWAEDHGHELISPACSADGTCFATVPPGDVVIVWVGGDEAALYAPGGGSQIGATDDVFDVITPLDVNLYFIAEGSQICRDYIAAQRFGDETGLGADAIAELVFGTVVLDLEQTWSATWRGEFRATDDARATVRERLDECVSGLASPSQLLVYAVDTAQRVATATANEDWATYRALRPEPAYTDAELEQGYEGLESATVVLASWTTTEDGAIDMALGLIAHESRPSGPQTALHCVIWRYAPDDGTILGLEGTANVALWPGFFDPTELTDRAATTCVDESMDAESPAEAEDPPATTVPPPFIVVPLDGLHVEMSGRFATVFDDCANVECTISGAATELGPVLPPGWWFADGYVDGAGALHVTATNGTESTTWAITDLFNPQEWQLH